MTTKDKENLLSDFLRSIVANKLKLDDEGDQDFQASDFEATLDESTNKMEAVRGALLTLLSESRRRQWSDEQLKEHLREITSSADFSSINDLLVKIIPRVDQELQRTAICDPHIVGFKWRLLHEVSNSVQGRVGLPVCLIEIQSQTPGKNITDRTTFLCNMDELQDLVGQLKEAKRAFEKVASF